MSGTGGRRTAPGLSLIGAMTAAMPALTRNLALEIAPIRVNLIAAGFVDTPLSATMLGDQLDARRQQLRARCRSGAWSARPTSPAGDPAHDQHAITGATFDIDGGQQLAEQ